jgi:hypothetical protein
MNYTQLVAAIEAYAENYDNSTGGFVDNIPVFIQNAEQRIYNTVQIPSLRKNVTGFVTAGNQYISLPDDWLSNYSIAVINTTGNYSYLLNKDVNFLREAYPKTTTTYTINGPTIPPALLAAAVNVQPQASQFRTTLIAGRPLGDITNNGTVTSADALQYNKWVAGVAIPAGEQDWIEDVMNPYMIARPTTYIDYLTATSSGDLGIPKYYALFGSQLSNPNEMTLMVAPTPDINYSVEMHYFYYPESITTIAGGQTWLGDNFDSVLLYGSLLEAGTFMKSDPDTMGVYKSRYDEALALLKRLGDGLERQDAYRSGQVRYPVK